MARLLIIDDEKMICQEFCEALSDLGHETDYATSAEVALEKITAKPYEMVFMDLSMPRVNGRDLFARIQQVSKVPVTFMSGFMSAQTEREVLSMGALRCLRKPVSLSDVVDLINHLDHFHPQAN